MISEPFASLTQTCCNRHAFTRVERYASWSMTACHKHRGAQSEQPKVPMDLPSTTTESRFGVCIAGNTTHYHHLVRQVEAYHIQHTSPPLATSSRQKVACPSQEFLLYWTLLKSARHHHLSIQIQANTSATFEVFEQLSRCVPFSQRNTLCLASSTTFTGLRRPGEAG